ncbi:DUF6538 domain-containing protein [Aureimonas sp. ME7]|uniref:DUF6538 domain-containing protein n=1 Tax=Aureimonas sp. ME7 TaxID=2744252 RepID=UPI0015FA4FED|nr:DUF6538 domain-containing protein [Aureimonas sp. ME7]
MVLAMSRPHKHPRTGIYWFRKRVPTDLVAVVGRKEVTESLETRDPVEAKLRHAKALQEYEARWATMRAGARSLTEREAHGLATVFYEKWIDLHRDNPSLEVVWHPEHYQDLWTFTPLAEEEPETDQPGNRPIENVLVPHMRRFCLTQAEYCLEHFGHEVSYWNRILVGKAIAAAMHRAHFVLKRMAEGHFEPDDAVPVPAETTHRPSDRRVGRTSSQPAVVKPANGAGAGTLTDLVEGWWRESKAAGRKPSTYESYRNTFSAFAKFLGHNDAGRVGRSDVIAFKDHRLATPSSRTGRVPSPKTVKDSDLTALKAVFEWAVMNEKVNENPAAKITIKLGKRPKLREKGFTEAEAVAILQLAMTFQPGRENARTIAAKRWVPWLCAFTGARLGEIAQLRKEDIAQREGRWILRITPEAGTVKTNEAREVVLHTQLLELGFPTFAERAPAGHLFINVGRDGDVLGPLQGLKNRLSAFARTAVADPNVAPFHGWRHRFKTIGMEVGIPSRVLDAIQGHAPRSVSDTYGQVTVKTIAQEIEKLPPFKLEG